jgi:hypothetical protein
MKKYSLFFIILLTVSCDKSNQFTSVEGYVTDYYSKKPVAGIPILIKEEDDPCFMCMYETDTVFSNKDGYYYYDFSNKPHKSYKVSSLISEYYFEAFEKIITEGRTNTINFSIKPFKTLTLNCYNKSNKFNWLSIWSHPLEYNFECKQCEELTVINFNIVPEYYNKFNISVIHYYENNKTDNSNHKDIKFFAGINDTTINYYY